MAGTARQRAWWCRGHSADGVRAVVVVTFIVCGLTSLSAFVAQRGTAYRGPGSAIDQFLAERGLRAEEVERALRPLPSDATIVVVSRSQSFEASMVFYIVNYLAFPRTVWQGTCNQPPGARLGAVSGKSVVLYRVPIPEWTLTYDAWAPEIGFAQATDATEWTAYCS